MNNDLENTPQAFPMIDYDNTERTIYPGMTLRDYFAAKAISSCDAYVSLKECKNNPSLWYSRTAEQAYKLADAMLAARSK